MDIYKLETVFIKYNRNCFWISVHTLEHVFIKYSLSCFCISAHTLQLSCVKHITDVPIKAIQQSTQFIDSHHLKVNDIS